MCEMDYALILAGGKSSRMHRDKTLMKYKNYESLTHFLFQKLSNIFNNVLVCAKSDKFKPPLPLIIDEFSEFCPLRVIANLDKHFSQPVFIIAADTPFIEFETIKILFENLKNHYISIPCDNEFSHWLCGFYNPKVSLAARELLDNNIEKISPLANHCSTVITKFNNKNEFLNINTMADYELIK